MWDNRTAHSRQITNRRVRRLPHDPKRIISEEIHAPSILSSRPLNPLNSFHPWSRQACRLPTSPRTDLFYFSAWQDYATICTAVEQAYAPGQLFLGGGIRVDAPVHGTPTIGIGRYTPINDWTDEVGFGSLAARANCNQNEGGSAMAVQALDLDHPVAGPSWEGY
jgi:hypothetical protein